MTDKISNNSCNKNQLRSVYKCVICLSSAGRLSSTIKGCQKIKCAALKRQDDIHGRVKNLENKFFYHMNNECFRQYTSKTNIAHIVHDLPVNISNQDFEKICIICGFERYKQDRTKLKISSFEKAKKFLAACHFNSDLTYLRMTSNSIKTPEDVLTKNVHYHNNCMRSYIINYERQFNKSIIDNHLDQNSDSDDSSNHNNESNNISIDSNNIYIESDGTNYSDFDSDIEKNNVNVNCEKKTADLISNENKKKMCNEYDENISERKKLEISKELVSIQRQLDAGEIFKLSVITDHINQSLDLKCQVTNRDVRTFIENSYQNNISFINSTQRNQSALFFISSITRDDAIRRLSSVNIIENSAKLIKESLSKIHFDLNDRFCDKLDLEDAWNDLEIPDPLLKFFSILFNYSEEDIQSCKNSEPTNSNYHNMKNKQKQNDIIRIKSLYQIMYFILHSGRKKTPLHLLTGIAIHSTCKSASLITSFNKIGLCVSYDDIRRVRLRLALYTIERGEGNVPLPSHFDPNQFTVAAFDNFDHNEGSLSGLDSSHDTVCVLFQNKSEHRKKKPKICETKVLKQDKTLKSMLDCQKLQDLEKPTNICIPSNYILNKIPKCDVQNYRYHTEDLFWIINRMNNLQLDDKETCTSIPSTSKATSATQFSQIIPSWAAYNSILVIDNRPIQISGYLPVLPFPVTEFSTVYTSLCNFKNVLLQLNQKHLPVFCDEGVYRIARHIKFLKSEEFSNIFVMLGSFHLIKVVLSCIGKFLKGSGIENILVETETFGPGTVEQVLSGSNYARSFKGFCIISEALQRLQIEAFLDDESTTVDDNDIVTFNMLRDTILEGSYDEAQAIYEQLTKKSCKFKSDFESFIVKRCSESELFSFWNNAIVMIGLAKNLVKADRTGDWLLHIDTVVKLQPLFHVLDRTNYARWLPVYVGDILQIKEDNPELFNAFMSGHFTIKNSDTPFSSIPVDQALECSINRSAKNVAGIIGSTAQKLYVTTWNLVYHEELDIKNFFRKLTSVDEDNYELYHHELSQSHTESSNLSVIKIITYINKYVNPFKAGNQILRNIITDEVPALNISVDLNKIWTTGCNNFNNFLMERLILKKKLLSDPIKRVNLKTMDSTDNKNKKQNTKLSDDTKEIQKILALAIERHYPRDLLLSYELTKKNMLFEDDGTLKLVEKNKLMDELVKKSKIQISFDLPYSQNTCLILSVSELCKKTKFKDVKTFKDYKESFIKNLVEIFGNRNLTRIDLLFDFCSDNILTLSSNR